MVVIDAGLKNGLAGILVFPTSHLFLQIVGVPFNKLGGQEDAKRSVFAVNSSRLAG